MVFNFNELESTFLIKSFVYTLPYLLEKRLHPRLKNQSRLIMTGRSIASYIPFSHLKNGKSFLA